jgi:hypothetical protein
VIQNSVGEGNLLVILMPGKKGSGLRLSEKELPERRSGAFRHKNTLANIHSFSGIQTHGLSVQAIKVYTPERAVTGTGPSLHNVPLTWWWWWCRANIIFLLSRFRRMFPSYDI